MTAILSNLQATREAIAQAVKAAHRTAAEVRLLAVSKTFPAEMVREAYQAGQIAFGENYLQEALDKIEALRDLPLEWHFIGPIQSNKTRAVAENFAWVHCVDRLKIAERLSAQRPPHLPPLNICLQVNVSGEASKSGVAPSEVVKLAQEVAHLPHLKLRGLMTIPSPVPDEIAQRASFALMQTLLGQLNSQGMGLDTLSMGMSHDFPLAIREGATIVRIGTAIFGARDYGGEDESRGAQMNITFIGGGNMAKSLISGLIKRGYSPSKMHVVEVSKEHCADLHKEFGVRATTELAEAVAHGETVILAIKPQQLQEVAVKLKPVLEGQLIVSIVAGIRTQDIARWLGTHNVVRCMPNTPALIRCGVTALYAMPAVKPEQCHRAESILAAVGSTLWIEDEEMLDAVTAISGSGPAYVFYFIEAMQQAAYELGLDEAQARQVVLDTFLGASKLVESSKDDVALLRAKVTSKNGTTERAILSMEANQVKMDIIAAIHAAASRSRELGDELGKDTHAG
jgi:pyrroline-5-carboxylate reductase